MVKGQYEIIELNEEYQIIRIKRVNELINYYYLEKIGYGNLYFCIGMNKKEDITIYENEKKEYKKIGLYLTEEEHIKFTKEFFKEYIQIAEESKIWKD